MINRAPLMPDSVCRPGRKDSDSFSVPDDDVAEAAKFACTYYGDVNIDGPKTFKESLRCYHEMPSLVRSHLSNGKIAGVPQSVTLCPLEKHNPDSQLYFTMSRAAERSALDIIFGLEDVLLECENLKYLKKSGLSHQTALMNQFASIVTSILQNFENSLNELIPQVRNGKKTEKELWNNASSISDSVSSPALLKAWTKGKHDEAKQLESFLHTVEGIDIVNETAELAKLTGDKSVEHLLVFCFGRITANDTDPFLELLQESTAENVPVTEGWEVIQAAWYNNESTVTPLKQRVEMFREFRDSNRGTAKFVVSTAGGGRRVNSHLEPGTVYLYRSGSREVFQPPSSPGVPTVNPLKTADAFSVHLTWTAPEYGTSFIKAYRVIYKFAEDSDGSTHEHPDEFTDTTATIDNLKAETAYCFAVVPVTDAGASKASEFSLPICTQEKPSFASKIIQGCDLVSPPEPNSPAWYIVPKKMVFNDRKARHQIFEVNKPPPRGVTQEKVIMMLGATGAGKTTLINGLVNYIFGVQHSDAYRLMLIREDTNKSQAHSQTKEITAYRIHHHPLLRIPFTLTIVDTPGYGDTEGIDQDQKITAQIREFFGIKGKHAIDQLHAVGFVAQSALSRLTDTQKYIFDSIQALFGKDVQECIFPLLTFADGREPQILGALREHKVPFKEYFKFNSSVFTQIPQGATDRATKPGEVAEFDGLFWQLASTSFKRFVTNLATKRPVSLGLTRDVLEERCKLETTIDGLQRHINEGLGQLSLMRQELEFIEQLDAEVSPDTVFSLEM